MGFINPYTFIPVNNGVKKPYNEYYKDENLLSGKIECTLKARTKLAVCDMISGTEADFFKVDGKAVIPGSSIRGTIRSIFEALTDSCFSSANAESDDYFSSRLNKKSPGLIEYNKNENKYILYKAERYKDEKNNQLSEYKTGDEVSFKCYSKKGKSEDIKYFKDVNNGFTKGYVHKVDRMKTNKDSIFEKKGKGNVISEKSIILLAENIEKYKPKDKKIIEEYKRQFEKMKAGNGMLPVWYHKDGDRYYFAPSQMSRAIFYTQPIDMLKEKNLDVCSDENKVCETCALFGIINRQNSKFVKSSKLRFSDAVCEDKSCFDRKYNLLLAPPRISSFEFYLKSNEIQYCADSEGVTIAGRKYYWHNTSEVKDVTVTDANKNMVKKVELVKAESEFNFCVYFDNITEIQLQKIVFALNLGENRLDSDKCHKIGHGKPLGLGSAKVVVDNIKVREFRDGKYREVQRNDIFLNNETDISENKNNVENILKVTDMKAVDSQKIHYPKTKSSDDIFKWFAENRKVLKSFGEPMEYYNKLPQLTDDNQELPENPKSSDNDSADKSKNTVYKDKFSNTLSSCKKNIHKNRK